MLTVATWNLENLFLPGTEGGPPDRAIYERKLADLAALLEKIEPDVLAVQEVGQAKALDDLRTRLRGEWQAELSPDADERGIRVGYLARRSIRAPVRIRAFPVGIEPVRIEDDGTATADMARGALQVQIDGITFITAHLKSKLLRFANHRFTPRDEDERARYAGYALALRAAEAITLRHRVTALLADGHDVILLGDLNDEPLAATTQILLGPPGSEFDSAGFPAPDEGDAQRLWNAAPLLPADRAFSRIFDGRRELIDHVLVSHALATKVLSADTGTTDLPSVSGPRPASDGSDHAPVYVRLDLD